MHLSSELRPTAADGLLRTLSVSANHNRLWIGFAAALYLSGDPARRRAAVRGLVATGIASGLANGVAKPLFPRRRPPGEAVPLVRRLISPPISSSFPSGHSASAAAFAAGVALEDPVAAAVIAPVALAVGYSRVHIGVHWPTDVAAGAALGAAVALATRRWWAVRPVDPATVRESRLVEPVHKGNGLLLVMNPGSGQGAGEVVLERIVESLPAARVLRFDPEKDFDTQIEDALRAEPTIALGVLGGDGTVSGVAECAVRHGLPLAVFPGGTLNHFARDVGADDIDATVDALEAGQVVLADTTQVRFDEGGERCFVNTASLGGYPDFVRFRERWEHRLGKWPAAALALIRVLFRAEPLNAVIDGVPTDIWMLFVGNGCYTPADQVPTARAHLRDSVMDVRYLRAGLPFSRLRLVWAAVTGTLGQSPTYVQRRVPEVDVRFDGAAVSLATDGEVNHRAMELTFTSRPGTLSVFRAAE